MTQVGEVASMRRFRSTDATLSGLFGHMARRISFRCVHY